jgi:hypothetical protein
MWGVKNIAQESNFFEGTNLMKTCFNDFFEIFKRSIDNTNLEVKTLAVPIIVAIGSESSGKSSLLENIVKCQLFPKNTTYCTKIPIHLIMKNTNDETEIKYKLFYDNKEITTTKENIYKEIEKIMNNFVDDICNDKTIKIVIFEKEIVDFEFYDLPGIRSYPPELALKTTNIAKKYLSMNNVIPICVIPATTPRITSYIPMALIKEYNKEKDTFICLTMCDRLQEENIEELLINRIISQTDEYETTSFGGICGIINRTHKNNVKLIDNDNIEKEWFKNNIYDVMSNEYKYKKELLENLGIHNFVNKISMAYKKYIGTKWLPDIIKKIKNENLKLTKNISDIGFDPQNNTQKKIFIDILLFWFETYLKDLIFDIYENFNKKEIEDQDSDKIQEEDDDSKNEESIFNDNHVSLNSFMSNLLINKFEEHVKFENLIKKLNRIKNIPSNNDDFIINIHRFSKLINNIKDLIISKLKEFNFMFMNRYEKFIEFEYLSNNKKRTLKKINTITINYMKEFIIYINKELNDNIYYLLETLENLEEDTKENRIQLQNEIFKNTEIINDLSKIIIQ